MTETEARDLSRREVVSFRLSGYTLRDLEAWGQEEKLAPRTLAGDAVEAVLGYARCSRCGEAVPFDYGDLQGKPPSYWIEDARLQVRRQKCRDHEPVRIGAGKPSAQRTGRKAAEGEKPPVARTQPRRPAPGSAVFQPPGEDAVVGYAAPEVPGRSRERGSRS